MMDAKKRIVFGILEFLNEEYNSPGTSAESRESLEVATQCLETAFGVTLQDKQFKGRKSLTDLFQSEEVVEGAGDGDGTVDLGPEYIPPPEASQQDKDLAEEFKNKGNDAMRASNYSEALSHYTRAVELDGRNSVFFCNRAAAYIKLEQYDQALRDCQVAIRLQPNYARAYGRMGVTFSSRNKHVEAIVCYRKALSLEPTNESYITNLRYSQNILAQNVGGGGAAGPAGLGGIENIIRNPNLINMAQQMLRDPAMHQMINNLMGGLTGGMGQPQPTAQESQQENTQAPPRAADNNSQPPQGLPLDNLMQMGQAIANSIRATNPELAEQLGVGLNFNFGNPPPSNEDNPPES